MLIGFRRLSFESPNETPNLLAFSIIISSEIDKRDNLDLDFEFVPGEIRLFFLEVRETALSN
jgi:hypothetical protein